MNAPGCSTDDDLSGMHESASSRSPGPHEQLTIAALLASGVRAAADREIVTRDGPRLDYPEFAERVRRLGAALTALGVVPGMSVAILDHDSHRYLEAYFAVPMLGAVLMTVNIRLSPAQIGYTIGHSGARVVLVNADFLDLLDRSCGAESTPSAVIVMGDTRPVPASLKAAYAGDYESLLAAAPRFEFAPVSEHAVATLFYTTGTTGQPKGVTYTHRQLVLHALSLATALGTADSRQSLRAGDVYMPMTPMFHVHAWGVPYVATMLGLKQVYAGRYEPAALLALRRAEGVSFSHCVPTILQMLIDADADKQGLRGWKLLIGGSALPPSLAGAATACGAHIAVGYGMSETGPVLTIARFRPDDGPDVSRIEAGLPIPFVQVRLLTASGDIVDARDGTTQGELLARAPWLTTGYHRDETASELLWRDGWLHTQDVATLDVDGTVRIVDRLKDVIKTGGEWVSSIDIEARVREHPEVAECAVVGRLHERWGERPVAWLKLVAGADATTVEVAIRTLLQRHVNAGRMSHLAIPDAFIVVPEIAKTSVGKFDKKLLRQQA